MLGCPCRIIKLLVHQDHVAEMIEEQGLIQKYPTGY